MDIENDGLEIHRCAHFHKGGKFFFEINYNHSTNLSAFFTHEKAEKNI